jgi:excisionase family DNA binding protein
LRIDLNAMATAIYLTSSDDNKSNQDRLAPLVDRVKSEGSQYKIFSEIPDKKGSQSLKKELLARVYDKEFDTILVYRLSDWSSSMLRLSSELREMDLKGIRFISCYENFDSFTLTGKLYIQVLLTVNECEKCFDLVGLDEACSLTGYSKNTLYQLISRKLIPHFKRPNGRRIFFSKRALEQWIMTGET